MSNKEKIEKIVNQMIELIDNEDMMEDILEIVYDLTGTMTNSQRAELAERL